MPRRADITPAASGNNKKLYQVIGTAFVVISQACARGKCPRHAILPVGILHRIRFHCQTADQDLSREDPSSYFSCTNQHLLQSCRKRDPKIHDTLPLPSQHIVLRGQEALSDLPMLPDTLQFLYRQKSGHL